MYSISDYIGNKIPIPETIAGVKVNADGSFVLTRQDVEKYYKCRFDDFKKLASEVSMQTFCSSDLYDT